MQEINKTLIFDTIIKVVISQSNGYSWSKIEIRFSDKYYPHSTPEHIILLFDELDNEIKRFSINSSMDTSFFAYLEALTKPPRKWNKCTVFVYNNLEYRVSFIWDNEFYLDEQNKFFNGCLYGLYEELLNKIGINIFPNYNFQEAKCIIRIKAKKQVEIEGEGISESQLKKFTLELDDNNLLLYFFDKTNTFEFRKYWKSWNIMSCYINLNKDLNTETDIIFSHEQ